MQEILEVLGPDIMPMITNLVISAIGIIFTILGYQVNKLIEKYKNHEDVKAIKEAFEQNQKFAEATVEYVEKISEQLGLKGQEKFELAKTKLIEVLDSKGINITETEVDLLIEQAHTSFNEGYNKKERVING